MLTSPVGDNCANLTDDVRLVQRLLNRNGDLLAPSSAVRETGQVDAATVTAIREFQRRYAGMSIPDGRVDPRGRTYRILQSKTSELDIVGVELPWIKVARREIGASEHATEGLNNPRILEYLSTFPYLATTPVAKDSKVMMGEVDETPWCACFVSWCLMRAGFAGGPSARARDWLNYGTRLERGRYGAIVVVHHTPGASTAGTTSSGNHVAFLTGGSGNNLRLLGGNQHNTVSERSFGGWTTLGYRWPR